MSSTMWGMPIMRSMSQLTAWSAQRGPSAAAAASASAMSEEATAAMRPTSTLVERPANVRRSMSRPIQSVPNGCESEGGRLLAAKSVAWAAGPAMRPATTTAASSSAPPRARAKARRRLGNRRRRGAESTGGWLAKTASVISDLLLPTHRAHTRIP